MQLDQGRDRVRLVAGELQRLHPLLGQLRADDVVVVEGHAAVGQEATGPRLADVVHQGGEARDEVRSAQPALEVDGLLEDGQGVLVDVLVPVVLVALQRQGGQLGQDQGGQPGLDEERQPQPGVRRQHQLDQLVADPLGGDDLDPAGHVRHRGDDGRVDHEAELRGEARGPHHPQGVVGERVLGASRRTQQPLREVDHAAERVHELARRHAHGHRVDGEVSAPEVALEGVAEVDRGLARGRVVLIRPVRRDLDLERPLATADRAERAADVPRRVGPAGEHPLDVVGSCRGGEVEVVVPATEHRVAHRSPDQGQLEAGLGEPPAELVDHRRDPVQLRSDVALGVGQPDAAGRSALCCFGHDEPA